LKRYPRVLIVAKSQIGDIDSAGAALRSWFKEWPRDHLAQVFSGAPATGATFCSRNFQLGAAERRWGSIFFRLKGSSLADGALPYREAAASAARPGFLSRAIRAVGRALVDSGVWELLFPPRLSTRLREFVAEFSPDVMFVQGCDIGFMRLPMLIGAANSTPIHFDIADDWVMHLYRGSLTGPVMGPVVDRTFRRLAQTSAGRYTIGEAMAEEYRARYGLPFSTLMQCDDRERFELARASAARTPGEFRIVYSGSLGLGRWRALLDLDRACSSLQSLARTPTVTAYVPFVPGEASDALRAAKCLNIQDAVPDAEVPGILARADLLFLPESFDRKISEYIRLSVSTKAHLYMMSGRPSLVYGPVGIGTIEYARRYGWGLVVDREGPEALAAALESFFGRPDLEAELLAKGSAVAEANHAGPVVREWLRLSLLSTCR
jgi:glycosyltransferase involved in cell wall biosynthesis